VPLMTARAIRRSARLRHAPQPPVEWCGTGRYARASKGINQADEPLVLGGREHTLLEVQRVHQLRIVAWLVVGDRHTLRHRSS